MYDIEANYILLTAYSMLHKLNFELLFCTVTDSPQGQIDLLSTRMLNTPFFQSHFLSVELTTAYFEL